MESINRRKEDPLTQCEAEVCACFASKCALCHFILSCAVVPADTAYVRVFISDVNDNKPVFAQRLYEVGVDENADVGLTVVTVSANDEDEGIA